MPLVRAAHGGNSRGVARGFQPVVNRGPDPATLDWGIAASRMAGDEQDDPLAGCDRQLESDVNCTPRAIQGHPMKVDDAVRPDVARAKPPIPRRIERPHFRCGPRRRRPGRTLERARSGFHTSGVRRFGRGLYRLPGKRADGRGDPLPQRLLVRA